MDMRDKARSDLYLAQLRVQSAPNTPGFGPLSPSFSQHMKSPRFPPSAYGQDSLSQAEKGSIEPGTRFVEAPSGFAQKPKAFALQAPPIKVHSPKPTQSVFAEIAPPAPYGGMAPPKPYAPPAATRSEPAPVAPGEQQYDAVPIPGAYATSSPVPAKATLAMANLPGQAVTSEHRVESPPPPSSPRLPRAGLR
jgi:hypothetical protein